MAGIYIHIPYCRRACSYCNFHFSTQLSMRADMLEALQKELYLRRRHLGRAQIRTLYFGGGTPSLLRVEELSTLCGSLHKYYDLSGLTECTLEANPEDICSEKLQAWQRLGINRLSIGLQSLQIAHRQMLGRLTSGRELEAVEAATEAGFVRISVDLIYGISEDMQAWREDIASVLSSSATHISAYSLTIEPHTLLANKVARGEYVPSREDIVSDQLDELCRATSSEDFVQYEVSSFAKPGEESLHNSNYWRGVKYLGIGPSAASYDGRLRWKNVSSNSAYVRCLQRGSLPVAESELLSKEMRWRELLLSGLGTRAGLSLYRTQQLLGSSSYSRLLEEADVLCRAGFLQRRKARLFPTQKGLKMVDSIALRLLK